MALDHFSIWHFRASHFGLLKGAGSAIVTTIIDWLTIARRRGRR
jgi:hypothetical protein